MDVEVIKRYQQWSDRGYVTALTCKNHNYHKLLPLQKGDGILLICPREDFEKQLGLAEFLGIKRKVEMAEYLWRTRT